MTSARLTDTDRVTFWVAGRPAPKGSRITGVRKDGTRYSRPASKHEKAWEGEVYAACNQLPGDQFIAAPYCVHLDFAVARPAKSTHGFPCRGDCDKLIRCTLDGLVKGLVLADDRYVTEIHSTVAYGEEPGALISVSTSLRHAEAA